MYKADKVTKCFQKPSEKDRGREIRRLHFDEELKILKKRAGVNVENDENNSNVFEIPQCRVNV